MLDDRPILQKSLIGAGAFSFIFAAAMAGTAFMISGGFGFGGERPHTAGLQQPAQLVSEVQGAMSDWATPPTEARTMRTSLSDQTPDQPWVDPAPAAGEDLAGQGSTPAPDTTEDYPRTDDAAANADITPQDDATSDESGKDEDDTSGF